jgi:hypothetical protein
VPPATNRQAMQAATIPQPMTTSRAYFQPVPFQFITVPSLAGLPRVGGDVLE